MRYQFANLLVFVTLIIAILFSDSVAQKRSLLPVISSDDSLAVSMSVLQSKSLLDNSPAQLQEQRSEATAEKVGVSQNLTANSLQYRVPISTLIKYDTSPENPEHKCYDIRKPITKKYTFLFNFLSSQKYRLSTGP